MTKLALLASFFILFSCKSNLHLSKNRRFNYSKKGKIGNEKLGLEMKSYGDIIYSTRRRTIRQALDTGNVKIKGDILFYGTTVNPTYSFVITHGATNQNEIQFSKDTTINGMNYSIIGYTSNPKAERSMKIDLSNIFNSITVAD